MFGTQTVYDSSPRDQQLSAYALMIANNVSPRFFVHLLIGLSPEILSWVLSSLQEIYSH